MPERPDFRSDFRSVYETWFEPVSRWIRALGGRDAERDDIVQEVFVVVRRRLPAFEGDNLGPWLYRITQRLVRDFSRKSWLKRFFNKRRLDSFDDLVSQDRGGLEALERKEEREEGERILDAILARMREARRATFVLFEIDGLGGEEIARLQGISVNTVWTRLHHARKEFFELCAKLQRARDAEEERRLRRPQAAASGRSTGNSGNRSRGKSGDKSGDTK